MYKMQSKLGFLLVNYHFSEFLDFFTFTNIPSSKKYATLSSKKIIINFLFVTCTAVRNHNIIIISYLSLFDTLLSGFMVTFLT